MELESVLYEVVEGTALITVNRPKVLNALNAQTLADLRTAFEAAKADGSVGVVILTGAGEKSFVAGADINEIKALEDYGAARAFADRGQGLLNFIERLGKPVIAAVNGFALGGGCEICMACHIRLASENAKFGQPEVGLGVIPGYGGTQRLARLAGKGLAAQLCLTGEMIDAAEAKRIGLVNQVYPQGELLEAARGMARTILSKGPLAVRYALAAVLRGSEMPLADGLEVEADMFAAACDTKDKMEGTSAFLEKRKPEFKGQ
jgi:enoyl-CoA hydratase